MHAATHNQTRAVTKVRSHPVQIIEVPQDRLLREAVRLIEEAQRDGHWTWSWLAHQAEISSSTIANWRHRKTKAGLTRTMNAALKPLGYKLVIGKIR